MAIVGQQASSGRDKKYTQSFNFQTVVNVVHNLNKKVTVSVIDSAGTLVIGKVNYISDNEVQLNFSAPFSGEVFCN